jgi:aspartate kinase
MKVFKFGGASVKDADSVRNVAHILASCNDEKIAAVISAMGKMTNALEKLLAAYYHSSGDVDEEFSKIKEFHLNIAKGLFADSNHGIFSEIENIFSFLKTKLLLPASDNYDYEYDQIVPIGEIISSKILSAYLNSTGINNTWIDARSIIRTDNIYREARIDWNKTVELVKASMQFNNERVYVTQGFIGSTAENISTTLGREGSDFSAAILAYSLDAEEVVIWKDVPGVLNADPKYFDNTVKLDRLSYYDAIELAYYGASVIHPKTIKPLQNKKIPLYVKSFANPKLDGTVIQDDKIELMVPSFIFKMNQVLITISPRDFSFIAEQNLGDIFYKLSGLGIRINVMQNTALSFSISVDRDEKKILQLIKLLETDYIVKYNTNLELVTIRNYDDETIKRVTKNKEILLEEKSRNTMQMVMRDIAAK